ncbi:MAG: four helix bundle protein [Desulfohalobiaceae bacterium]|nr:four helix bundle protein [Desulfohalobiaceae bacterium]
MKQGLAGFGAYQKSLELFDLVVNDMALLQKDVRCYRLISQQIGSADSICSNIEEGYGRLSRREYVRFLDIARGSARETQGRYGRMKHWLAGEIIAHRAALCGEIIAILTSSINRLREEKAGNVEC